MIIANTIKGKGVSFMELNHKFHGKAPDDEQFKQWSEVVLDQAMLAERGSLKDPASFVARLNKLMLSLTK